MNELKKPSPENIALAREWQRQFESGELAAGYWQWYVIDGASRNSVACPNWPRGYDYEYEPRLNHPHYAVYKEWEAHKASGTIDRGEYVLKACISGQSCEYHNTAQRVSWCVENTYAIEKTDKHPDNKKPKPKPKLLDWSKVPVGTMTNNGEVRLVALNQCYTEHKLALTLTRQRHSYLRLLPATKWTAIQDGESPPVFEGLVIEYRETRDIYIHGRRFRNNVVMNENMPLINAYRVVGIAEGWTDDPTKAVQS